MSVPDLNRSSVKSTLQNNRQNQTEKNIFGETLVVKVITLKILAKNHMDYDMIVTRFSNNSEQINKQLFAPLQNF
jgi:hypothetical protein